MVKSIVGKGLSMWTALLYWCACLYCTCTLCTLAFRSNAQTETQTGPRGGSAIPHLTPLLATTCGSCIIVPRQYLHQQYRICGTHLWAFALVLQHEMLCCNRSKLSSPYCSTMYILVAILSATAFHGISPYLTERISLVL